MAFTALFRQFDLLLALRKTRALFSAGLTMAMGAGDALRKIRRGFVLFANRPAAGVAHIIIAGL